MNDVYKSLTDWFLGRPKWLTIAANQLSFQTELTDKDISDLASLCLKETRGELNEQTFSVFPPDFSQVPTGMLRLSSIQNVEGVNALAPQKPLELGKSKSNVTIVYGINGSGKSGYVRLLQHVCGASRLRPLLGNVYLQTPSKPKATISFELNEKNQSFFWSGHGTCSELTSVDIFDVSYGEFFSNAGEEVNYELPVLSLFSFLVEICTRVGKSLDVMSNAYPSRKPNMPSDLRQNDEGIWYESISAMTSQSEIELHCQFDSRNETEIQTLEQRLSEQSPSEMAKHIRQKKHYLDSLVEDANIHMNLLSFENCKRFVALKNKVRLKKAYADMVAEKAFSDSHLEGIGSDVWIELWESARKYSTIVAYKGVDYPNTTDESRCVLCHQQLDHEAKNRLTAFEIFVKGEAQKAIFEANKEYNNALRAIDVLPTEDTLKIKIDAAGITEDQLSRQIYEFYSQLKYIKNMLLEIDSENAISAFPLNIGWIEYLVLQSDSLEELSKKYEEDAKTDNREDIIKTLDKLRARKWLSVHRINIIDEIHRLKKQVGFQKGKELTNTSALSRKKAELTETLITNAFVEQFNLELKKLGASRINVVLEKAKTQKAHVYHKILLRDTIQNCAITDVLSEGERRIISIAAFLAYAKCKNSQAPLILDDPISSLDQNYEERVVQRLLEISADRQVIVFTHRLSLLGNFQHYAKKHDIIPHILSIRSNENGKGLPAPIPINQKELGSTLDSLLKNCHQLRQTESNADIGTNDMMLKSICSEFRIALERSIECDLLCAIIQRFQRSVNTLQLMELTKICEADCKLLDALMTKYSCHEHSQPEESPIGFPSLDEIIYDINELINWRSAYKKRQKQPSM